MSRTLEEIKAAMEKRSFKTNGGKGARVCYPNEIIKELFGEEAMKDNWIKE